MYTTTTIDLSQPLDDRNERGRRQPWAEHRANTDILAWAYEGINESKAGRLRTCSPQLIYTVQDADGQKRIKLHTAWFCRVRLCPVCQWRRSLKIYGQAAEVIRTADTKTPGGYGWIMLTLTMRNVQGQVLSAAIDKIGKSWHRLLKLEAWQKVVLGTMRSLEVTHNLDIKSPAYDTYHPHIHVLVCVDRKYFKSRNYLNRQQWAALWQRALRVDYTPQVWVSRIQSTNPHQIAEVAKYATKPEDYILPSDLDKMIETIAVLDKALNRRRLVSWTGLLKTIHADLGLDDTEDGDLIHTSENAEEAASHIKIAYRWMIQQHNYYREVETCHEENECP